MTEKSSQGRREMNRAVKVYQSFEESDRADRDYYRSLTPEQRMRILFELNERMDWGRNGEPAEGFPRVYRVIELT